MDPDVKHTETDDGFMAGEPVFACPFCGEVDSFTGLVGLAEEYSESGAVVQLSAVGCAECGSTGPLAEGGLAGALAAWNGRPAPAREGHDA